MSSLDPHVQRFLAILGAGNRSSLLGAGAEQRRADLSELLKLGGPAPPIGRTEDFSIPGAGVDLPARLYTPVQTLATPAPGLIYFHGGGLVAGSIDTHDFIARALANAGACRVVSVGYRLAPEHPFPAAVEDALAASSYLLNHAAEFGIDGARFGLGGDSAGATLAAVTCQRMARAVGPRPAMQLLLCPILDHDPSSTAGRHFGSGDPVDQATLDHDLEHYLPADVNRADPLISPLWAEDLAGLPPTLIHTAECDPLRDDGHRYHTRLREAGSPVLYRCHTGMIHLFYGLGGVIPYARRFFDDIGADVRAALTSQAAGGAAC